MIDLSSLDEGFNKKKAPNFLQMVFYSFWDKGISLKEFCDLPMPYIFDVLATDNYIHEEQRKELEKSKKKSK